MTPFLPNTPQPPRIASSIARRLTITPNYRFAVRLLLFVVFLSSCATQVQHDLEKIYSEYKEFPKQHPVILIPGSMGSKLVNEKSGREIWPGGLMTFIFGTNLSELRLPVTGKKVVEETGPLVPSAEESGTQTTALIPTELFDKLGGQNYYAKIIDTLTDVGGYNCVLPAEIDANTDCVLFPWDWRKDLTQAAAQLDQHIETLRQVREDENLTVDLVAHSAGGLVARYYARYGTQDVLSRAGDGKLDGMPLSGAAKIRKIALVATPNMGSIPALQRAVRGEDIGIATISPEILATMPGLYQTLPHPNRDFMIDIHGNQIKRDLYDIDTWKLYQWVIFNPKIRQRVADRFATEEEAEAYLQAYEQHMVTSLTRAKRFHEALSAPMESTPIQYIVFGSACILTPSVCLLERVNGETRIRLYPDEVINRQESVNYRELMLDPGDGTVTKASLLARKNTTGLTDLISDTFPIEYSIFICENHATYTSNATFRDNLMNSLLY